MTRQTYGCLMFLSSVVAAHGLAFPICMKAPVPASLPPKTITNNIGMKLVRIPAGRFKMGSPTSEQDVAIKESAVFWNRKPGEAYPGEYRVEAPQHNIDITKTFWLGIHEVTQKQFKQVMSYNPSYFSKDDEGKDELEYFDASKPADGKSKVAGVDTSDFPVENVSWEEALEFCKKLTARDEVKPYGWMYRLPTEAEWEYACRGGAPSYQVFHFGNFLTSKQANFDGNYPFDGAPKGPYLARTCKVGSYQKNRLGLYDMHGNVQEWCADWYDDGYYRRTPSNDPPGPAMGKERVIRSGDWNYHAKDCRSAARDCMGPGSRSKYVGFRVALSPSRR
jgi:formylglycine-generating enzyme required for sulfatase activity